MSEAEKHLAAHASTSSCSISACPMRQGLGALRRARAAAPRVPLVVLTGMDDESLAAQALQEGAQDYLVKGRIVGGSDVETRGLLRALRYAIERKVMEEALFDEKERAEVTLNCIGDARACTDVWRAISPSSIVVAERMTGWSLREAAGRPMAEVLQILDATSGKAIPDPMAMAIAAGPADSPAVELHPRPARWVRDSDRRHRRARSTTAKGR